MAPYVRSPQLIVLQDAAKHGFYWELAQVLAKRSVLVAAVERRVSCTQQLFLRAFGTKVG